MLERISIDPTICHGNACIKGTRVPVYLILEMLSAGDNVDGILKAYPFLSKNDVLAAIEFGAKMSKESVIPIGVETK